MTYTTEMKHALTMYDNLSLDKTFETLYAHTDKNGVLYVPMASRDSDDRVMICKMNWTERDVAAIKHEFEVLYKNLRLLSRALGKYDGTDESIKNALNPAFSGPYQTWQTYIRPFDMEEFDDEYIEEIELCMELLAVCDQLEREHANGEEWTDEDREFYDAHRNTEILPEDLALVDAFYEALNKKAEERLGNGPAALELSTRAKRVCRLFSHNAPHEVVLHEARLLCQAMAIHRFASVYELCV